MLDLEVIKARNRVRLPGSTNRIDIATLVAEVERLQAIEAAARAYLAAYDAGDTMAHAERDGLRVALQETKP